jgi:hypothetical protein
MSGKGTGPVTVSVSKETKQLFEKMEARLASMETEIKTLKSGIAAEAAAATLEQLQNPARRSKEAVIGRQASRAGMTKTEWLAHCERTGHDPAKMDKSIPNHEHKASRGGKRVDKRPRGKRKLTAAEERQKQERLGQRTIYDEVKKKTKK